MPSPFQPQPHVPAQPAGAAMAPPHSRWVGEPDDVAFGRECADPALQIACWGQQAGAAVQATASS